MRRTFLIPLASLAALAPAAPAVAAVEDFRLPADPATQQPPPDRQGPVAPDVPASRAGRATPAPTPTLPAARAPEQTVAPQVVVPPTLEQTPAPRATRTPLRVPPATNQPAPATGGEEAPVPATTADPAFPVAAAPRAAPPAAVPRVLPAEEGGSLWWLWVLIALAALGAVGFAAWRWWQLQRSAGPVAVPQIERPRVVPTAASSPTAVAPAVSSSEPLQVALEPLRLSLTLLNATLAYRLEIANRGTTPIVGLKVGADMIAAHSSMSREEQLAGPGSAAVTVQRIERLEPGESRIVEGEFRVPFSQIVPIRQGNAALLLPLARFRLDADGSTPVVRTFAVGQPGTGPGAGLQPFRLDLGPRVYPKLSQRAFA